MTASTAYSRDVSFGICQEGERSHVDAIFVKPHITTITANSTLPHVTGSRNSYMERLMTYLDMGGPGFSSTWPQSKIKNKAEAKSRLNKKPETSYKKGGETTCTYMKGRHVLIRKGSETSLTVESSWRWGRNVLKMGAKRLGVRKVYGAKCFGTACFQG